MSPERLRLVQRLNQALIESGGLCTLEDLVALARERRVQIWDEGEALAVTELQRFPRRTLCHTIVAAGPLTDILAMEPRIADFARAEGADLMVAHGRPGWSRVGAKIGWRPHATVYFKALAPRLNGGSGP